MPGRNFGLELNAEHVAVLIALLKTQGGWTLGKGSGYGYAS